MNHYNTLGVPRDASAAAIKKAYRGLAKKYHPDHGAGNEEKMAAVNTAYEVLSDPERRAHYDQTGQDNVESLDKRAADRLIGIFNEWLEHEGPLPGNVIEHMRAAINQSSAGLKQRAAELRRKTVQIEKKAKRVRGPQVLQDLVAHKRNELIQQADGYEEQIGVNDRVLALLVEYEDTEPEETIKNQYMPQYSGDISQMLRQFGLK